MVSIRARILGINRKFLQTNKYLLLFLYLIFSTMFFPLGLTAPVFMWFVHTVLIVLLLAIIYAIHKNTLSFIFPLVLGSTSALISFMVLNTVNESIVIIRYTLMLLFYLNIIYLFIKDITTNNIITKDLLLGSLCVYIIIALLFGSIFFHLEYYFPQAFDLSKVTLKDENELIINLVYFSFTALTTVGFGDIVAKSIGAKCFVIIEEITGIFYLAVLVSRLVFADKKN